MAESTSSAEPRELFAYSAVGRRINSELNSEACRLADALQHFQATCREFAVPVGHLPGEISSYTGQADGVDAWTRQVGMAFEAADRLAWLQQIYRQAALPLAAGATAYFGFWNRFFHLPLNEQWEFWEHDYDFSRMLLESRDLLRGLRSAPGTTYNGQVKISGSSELKELAGWSRNLTHMRWDLGGTLRLSLRSGLNEGWHTFRDAINPTDSYGRFIWVASAVVAVHDNVQKHRHENASKVAIGTVTDTLINAVCAAGGAGFGAAAGGVIGGVIVGGLTGGVGGPLGVAIGAKIGGMAGAWAGGKLAEEIGKTKQEQEFVDTLDRAAPAPVHSVLTAMGNLEIWGNDTAEAGLNAAGKWIGGTAGSAFRSTVDATAHAEHALTTAAIPLTTLFQPAL